MNRLKFLKTLGIGVCAAVATPVAVVATVKAKPAPEWEYSYLWKGRDRVWYRSEKVTKHQMTKEQVAATPKLATADKKMYGSPRSPAWDQYDWRGAIAQTKYDKV